MELPLEDEGFASPERFTPPTIRYRAQFRSLHLRGRAGAHNGRLPGYVLRRFSLRFDSVRREPGLQRQGQDFVSGLALDFAPGERRAGSAPFSCSFISRK